MLVVLIALSMVFTLAPLLMVGGDPDDPKIYVSPATISDAVTNNDYTVCIKVANVTDLYAWEFQLDYPTSILSLTYASNITAGLNTPQVIFRQITDTTNGLLWWAVSTVYPTTAGKTLADQAIFEIHFHTIGTGVAALHLHGDVLADHNGNAITHTTVDGSITVGTRDLTVTSVSVLDYGCSIFANDTYADGSTYYYPVNVTIQNTGTMAAGSFFVRLDVYWLTGSLADGTGELAVTSLAAGAELNLTFTTLFHPTHTHYYTLTATVDSHNQVVESNEGNNVLVHNPGPSGIKVTVMGDINGDTTVNVLDAVAIAQAWQATPSSSWWNLKADINHDGAVDILDGTRIGLYWGKSW